MTAKQARLKKEEDEKCSDINSAACYDHTANVGIGPIKVSDKFPEQTTPVYDYSEVLHKSFLFYFVQRSGKLPYQVHFPHPSALDTTREVLCRKCTSIGAKLPACTCSHFQ